MTRPAPPRERARIFYGWYITGAGSLNNFVLSAITFWGFGVFVQPLHEEFGWSAATIAAGFSIRSFQQGFLAPFVGIMIDRIGPRKMVLLGTVLFAAGFVLFAVMDSIPMYFAASLLIALGQSVGSFTAFTAVLMRWFTRKRGRAMGLLNAGNGAGYFLVPGLAWVVTVAGWREALLVCAAVALVFGIASGLLVRDDPSELGLVSDGGDSARGEDGSYAPAVALTGATVGEALRSPAFWLVSVALALSGGAVNAWTVHTIPHLQNVGFSLTAATTAGVGFAACQLVFRPLGGFFGDRIGRRRLFILGFVLMAVGLVLFSLLTPQRLWLFPLYYATYAFGQATWVVLQAATIADYFGAKRFGTISGLANLLHMPLGVATPILVGAAFDHTGTYTPALLSLAAGPALAALCVMLAPAPPTSEPFGAAASTPAAPSSTP